MPFLLGQCKYICDTAIAVNTRDFSRDHVYPRPDLTCVMVSLGLLPRPFHTLILIIDQTPGKKILWFITLLSLRWHVVANPVNRCQKNPSDYLVWSVYLLSTSSSLIGETGYSGYARNHFGERHVSSTRIDLPGWQGEILGFRQGRTFFFLSLLGVWWMVGET